MRNRRSKNARKPVERAEGTRKLTATMPNGITVTRTSDRVYRFILVIGLENGEMWDAVWTSSEKAGKSAWQYSSFKPGQRIETGKKDESGNPIYTTVTRREFIPIDPQ